MDENRKKVGKERDNIKKKKERKGSGKQKKVEEIIKK